MKYRIQNFNLNFILTNIFYSNRLAMKNCIIACITILKCRPKSCTLTTRRTTFPAERLHLAVFIYYVADTRLTIPASVLFQMLSIINVYRCFGKWGIILSKYCCWGAVA